MQPATERFAAAVRSSHRISTTVLLVDPVSGEMTPLDAIDGSVTLDGTAATRGACSVTVAPDPALVPTDPDSGLAPYGNELQISSGVVYPDGAVEEVPLGVFRIDETAIDDTGSELQIQISGLDRSARVIEAVFRKAGTLAAGTNVATAIEDRITEFWPDCAFDLAATAVTTPLLSYEQGGDRWEVCLALAESAQCDLYFDSRGTLTMRKHPEALSPDLTIAEGEGGTMLGANLSWGREDACNRVVVTGEGSSTDPAYGEAIDDDPTSPTNYYRSAFGQVTFPYSSEYVTSDAQAVAVAERILSLKLGTGRSISLTALRDPRLRPFDTIEVTRQRLGLASELHIVDSVTIPLTSEGQMSVQTRVARMVG